MAETLAGGPDIQGTDSGTPQEPTTEPAERETPRRVAFPSEMREDLRKYVASLYFAERKKNEEGLFFEIEDEDREQKGLPRLNPQRSRQLQGRPRGEPENAYEKVYLKYAVALTDSPRKIGRDKGGIGNYGPWLSSFPLGVPPKIDADEAEKRTAQLKVDMTDFLEFLEERQKHKTEDLERITLNLLEAQGRLSSEAPENVRALAKRISDLEDDLINNWHQLEKDQEIHGILDRVSAGEWTERQANRVWVRYKAAQRKEQQRTGNKGRERDALVNYIEYKMQNHEEASPTISKPETPTTTEPPGYQPGKEYTYTDKNGHALPASAEASPLPEETSPPQETTSPQYEVGSYVTWIDDQGNVHTSRVKNGEVKKEEHGR